LPRHRLQYIVGSGGHLDEFRRTIGTLSILLKNSVRAM
jgi:hypothetical protein